MNPDIPLGVETDASDHAIAAALRHSGCLVEFFSRTVSKSERIHSAVEKEAYDITEAIKNGDIS